jgi:hypothetical protein
VTTLGRRTVEQQVDVLDELGCSEVVKFAFKDQVSLLMVCSLYHLLELSEAFVFTTLTLR